MKCKFCNSKMESVYIDYIDRNVIYCNNHKPTKVFFKTSSHGDRWIISKNNYRLIYWNNYTILQKIHCDTKSTVELIKKFDFELQILPEEFDSKLKTILTFL